MQALNNEETVIDSLITLGTVTYKASGWGTGEITVKCRSDIKCEEESLNKAVIELKGSEDEVKEDNVEDYVIRELGKKLANREIHVLTVEDKKYNIAKRKFKVWKDTYKSQNRA